MLYSAMLWLANLLFAIWKHHCIVLARLGILVLRSVPRYPQHGKQLTAFGQMLACPARLTARLVDEELIIFGIIVVHFE